VFTTEVAKDAEEICSWFRRLEEAVLRVLSALCGGKAFTTEDDRVIRDDTKEARQRMKPGPLRKFLIKDHARFQMERRQISEDQVRQVLTAPQQIIEKESGRYIYQSRLHSLESGKERLFRVVVDTRPEPVEVVTVYRTSRIAKYWRQI
jgi:hypothetical protein